MSVRQNAMLLAVLTVLIAVMGDWAFDSSVSRFWRLPAGLLLVGLVYEALSVRRWRLAASVTAAEKWPLGTTQRLTWHFSHQARRSLLIEFAPAAPAAVDIDGSVRSLHVPADGAASLEAWALPRRLGPVQWPPMQARIAGPLGLAWWPAPLQPSGGARVVPDLLRPGERSVGRLATGPRASLTTGAGTEVLQLRAFRAGDALRAVDWKATARRRELICRDVLEDQHLTILIALDAGRGSGQWAGGLDQLGHYINAAARFAQHAVANDDQVGLVVYGDKPLAVMAPQRGAAAVTKIRSLLAEAQVQPVDSNPLLAATCIRGLIRQRALVIMLTEPEDASGEGQLVRALDLLQAQHLVFVVGVAAAADDQLASAPARDWLDPYYALAALERRRQRDRNLRALQARGVPAIVARPEQLQAALIAAYTGFRRRHRV